MMMGGYDDWGLYLCDVGGVEAGESLKTSQAKRESLLWGCHDTASPQQLVHEWNYALVSRERTQETNKRRNSLSRSQLERDRRGFHYNR